MLWLSIRLLCMQMTSLLFLTSNHLLAQPFLVSGYGQGISASTLHPDGSMSPPVLIAQQASASFFCFHPSLDVLYVVSETMRNDPESPAKVVAYRFDRPALMQGQTPNLKIVNSHPVDGDIPCHVVIDSTGQCLIISNYINGSVVAFTVAEDGSIGKPSSNIVHEIVPGKKASNAHCCAISPGNGWALVADLGLDRVMIYSLDATSGQLTAGPQPYMSLPAGSGPRHLSFHPNGQFVYIINESNMTMASAQWDETTGQLTLINIETTLPPGTEASGFSTAEVLVHPEGRFVFGSNRGHDSIVTMHIDPSRGSIVRAHNESTHGKTPRNFRLTPSGEMLLAENQTSSTVVSFRIDQESGQLLPTGHSISVESPSCIRFLTEGKQP